ncbi:MAG: nickel pincer cofactor biosynthesis protein LarC [Thermaerobacter sp.]|nr:nickel pincer cofactor biosynthesis protein LarC [Thermaerobacter sp.]
MRHLYLNCFDGISGDMALAALLDLGLPEAVLRDVLRALGLEHQVRLAVRATTQHSIGATALEVVCAAAQPLRRLSEILSLLGEAGLPDGVRERSAATFHLLVEAEGRVHGVSPAQVNLHELGALDTIVDVVGFAAGLDHLKIQAVSASPVPWFTGRIETEHGFLSLPAPAVLELLRGIPIVPGERAEEIVTPTGAALLVVHAGSFGPPPAFRLKSVGYGAGRRAGSLLRAVLGEVEVAAEGSWEEIAVLETNLDDMDPRLYPPLLEQLLGAGALDAFATTVQMKKGRPGVQLTVLALPEKAGELCDLLLLETTSLGVRVQQLRRRVAAREIRRVDTAYGSVRVKLAMLAGRVVGANPELEDCRSLAQQRGVPLKVVMASAQAAAQAAYPVCRAGGG